MAVDLTRLKGRAGLRATDEPERTTTTLELLFDLVVVVAVGAAASTLHHQLADGHVVDGLLGFAGTFFAIWWLWVGYTWFASAHDGDDVTHRLLTLVQMAGALVIAASVRPAAFDGELAFPTIGYAVARVGLVLGWLRVARDHPDERRRALRYAVPLTVLLVAWLARLALPGGLGVVGFVLLVAAELCVPWYAASAAERPRFHPAHIEERYGLFVIILLGETILSATSAFAVELDAGGLTPSLLALGVSGLVLAFGAWWLYFDHPGHLAPKADRAFPWGYAHLPVFVGLAAMGSGVAFDTEVLGPEATGDERLAALSVAIPSAVFLLGLALIPLVNRTRVLAVRVWPKVAAAAVLVVAGATTSVVASAVISAAVVLSLVVSVVLDADIDLDATAEPEPETSADGRRELSRRA